MILWLDAQLPPQLSPWLRVEFNIDARTVREIGLRDAKDRQIFEAAREAKAVVMTKDADFLALVERHGTPPQVIWITCGNTTNARLKHILNDRLRVAIQLLESGEPIVEIGGGSS